jgi:sensor domain CHASE-containing protein
MPIKVKTGIILLGFFILFSLFLYGIQRTTIHKNIQALEYEAVQKDLFRSLNAVSSEIDRIESICRNWAALDDTYDLFITENGDYSEPDFPETIFTINRINLILVCDTRGKTTWWDCRDLVTGRQMTAVESLVVKIQQTPSLLSHDPDALVYSSSGVMLAEPYPGKLPSDQ